MIYERKHHAKGLHCKLFIPYTFIFHVARRKHSIPWNTMELANNHKSTFEAIVAKQTKRLFTSLDADIMDIMPQRRLSLASLSTQQLNNAVVLEPYHKRLLSSISFFDKNNYIHGERTWTSLAWKIYILR